MASATVCAMARRTLLRLSQLAADRFFAEAERLRRFLRA